MRPRIGITSAPTVYDERLVDRVNRWYVDAVVRSGGLPVILPTLDPDRAGEAAGMLDGLLLIGGGDVDPARYHQSPAPEIYDVDPTRDAWELALVGAARLVDPAVVVLGICRGAQLLNVEAGGTLVQHLPGVATETHWQRPRDREEVHGVDLVPGSRLAEILGRTHIGVNSVHHQAIDRVGEGLVPVAWAPDGIVEAVEAAGGAPVLAVQWHPESLIDLPSHPQLFLWLTRAAAGRRSGLDRPATFEAAPGAAVATAGRGHRVDEVA